MRCSCPCSQKLFGAHYYRYQFRYFWWLFSPHSVHSSHSLLQWSPRKIIYIYVGRLATNLMVLMVIFTFHIFGLGNFVFVQMWPFLDRIDVFFGMLRRMQWPQWATTKKTRIKEDVVIVESSILGFHSTFGICIRSSEYICTLLLKNLFIFSVWFFFGSIHWTIGRYQWPPTMRVNYKQTFQSTNTHISRFP